MPLRLFKDTLNYVLNVSLLQINGASKVIKCKYKTVCSRVVNLYLYFLWTISAAHGGAHGRCKVYHHARHNISQVTCTLYACNGNAVTR